MTRAQTAATEHAGYFAPGDTVRVEGVVAVSDPAGCSIIRSSGRRIRLWGGSDFFSAMTLVDGEATS